MNCRQANRLLPLWIGRDLADASESEALREHVAKCPDCAARQEMLQQSLDALQLVSTGVQGEGSRSNRRPSLWPGLSMVLGEMPRRRDQFNGWIPATAMAIAAAVMVGVSVLQVQREFGDSQSTAWTMSPEDQTAEQLGVDEHPGPSRRHHAYVPHPVRYNW